MCLEINFTRTVIAVTPRCQKQEVLSVEYNAAFRFIYLISSFLFFIYPVDNYELLNVCGCMLSKVSLSVVLFCDRHGSLSFFCACISANNSIAKTASVSIGCLPAKSQCFHFTSFIELWNIKRFLRVNTSRNTCFTYFLSWTTGFKSFTTIWSDSVSFFV